MTKSSYVGATPCYIIKRHRVLPLCGTTTSVLFSYLFFVGMRCKPVAVLRTQLRDSYIDYIVLAWLVAGTSASARGEPLPCRTPVATRSAKVSPEQSSRFSRQY
eukprot:1176557-Prorocentrum_minimum.AAC.2